MPSSLQRPLPDEPAAGGHFSKPILDYARRDVALLGEHLTIQEAISTIREHGLGERIIYFYVVDAEQRLAGVLPTRRLLTSPADARLSEVMVRRVAAIPQSSTVLEACDFFVLHKFLAFPVIDENRRVVGTVDVSLLTEEILELDASPGDAPEARPDEVFEIIGFHLAQVRGAGPRRAFRFRFPWLLATVGSGTACALLSGFFEKTLAHSLVLAFFLTMVLGLSESVSIQSMTLAIQAWRAIPLTWRSYASALRREVATALLLGAGCGGVVAAIVWLWRGEAVAALAIGGSIALSLVGACVFGLSVPTLLHALKLDPKIAAGPLTLALADVMTLLIYFSLATALLR